MSHAMLATEETLVLSAHPNTHLLSYEPLPKGSYRRSSVNIPFPVLALG